MVKKRVITWKEFGELAEALSMKILEDEHSKYDLVIGILRGGGPVALVVADRLRIPVDFVNVKSYVGISSRKEPRVLSTITEEINGRSILLVDDLVDEGATMRFMVNYLSTKFKPKLIRTSVLFIKPWSTFKPDYYLDTVEEWIVFPWELCEFDIRACNQI